MSVPILIQVSTSEVQPSFRFLMPDYMSSFRPSTSSASRTSMVSTSMNTCETGCNTLFQAVPAWVSSIPTHLVTVCGGNDVFNAQTRAVYVSPAAEVAIPNEALANTGAVVPSGTRVQARQQGVGIEFGKWQIEDKMESRRLKHPIEWWLQCQVLLSNVPLTGTPRDRLRHILP